MELTSAAPPCSWAKRKHRDVSRCRDRKSTRLNSSHGYISDAGFCLKKKKNAGSAREAGRSDSDYARGVDGQRRRWNNLLCRALSTRSISTRLYTRLGGGYSPGVHRQ